MKKNSHFSKASANKYLFTIIELLVVIAIIILLTSLLMPAMKTAKGVAQKAQCGNKIKQIAVAVFSYSNDFNDSIPGYLKRYRIPISGIDVYWHNYINYYYFNGIRWSTVANPSINFVCPADQAPSPFQGTVTSYGFNAHIMPGVNANRLNMRFSNLSTPTETYMLSDSAFDLRYFIGNSSPPYIRLEHNRTTNMCYTDGHIGSLREQPPTPSSALPWSRSY